MQYSVASDKIVSKVLDDEAVVINLETGIYYGMDGIAAKLWELASEGVSRTTIVALAERHFPGQADVAADVGGFLDRLCADGLLKPSENGTGTEAPVNLVWPAAYRPPEIIAYDDVAEMVALDPPLPELAHTRIDQPAKP